MTEEEKEIVRRFHQLYYNTGFGGGTWTDTYWRGRSAQKCPLDLWIYQEIISEVKPEIIIETGTADGGSGLFLADMCALSGKGRVISIDVKADCNLPQHSRMTYLTGSSTADDVIQHLRREIQDIGPVMVLLDSDHRMEHVLKEMRLYSSLVTSGSYLIVEDTNINGHPVYPEFGLGPMEAVELFLRENSSFDADCSREKFFLTQNPNGFLRKRDDP